MDKQLAREIIRCLPQGRTLYAYGKDAYALQLLKYFTGQGKKISLIKQSRYARLLEKKPVKNLLAAHGGNRLCATDIDAFRVEAGETFSLSLDLWDGSRSDWAQTSRRGWNLVLQLNFCNRHNSRYRKLVKPVQRQILNYRGHPVFRRHQAEYFRETLAWARLDADFKRDECLIEEIQSDWIRVANNLLQDARSAQRRKRKQLAYWPVAGRLDDIIEYCEYLNRQYTRIWAEAMLSATLHFVKTELGLRQVYYHSSQSGAQIKKMGRSRPPKSLYSQLPRAFCFRETIIAPQFMQADTRYNRLRRRLREIRWQELAL